HAAKDRQDRDVRSKDQLTDLVSGQNHTRAARYLSIAEALFPKCLPASTVSFVRMARNPLLTRIHRRREHGVALDRSPFAAGPDNLNSPVCNWLVPSNQC